MDPPRFPPNGHAALRRHRLHIPGHVHLVTSTTIDRQRLFSHRFDATCAAARRLAHPGVASASRVLAWVLMPDHAHWLLQVGTGETLADAVCRLKSATARAYNEACGRRGAVWARAFHDRALRRDDDLQAMARYLVLNPVRAGLVKRVGDYPFWDAVWV